MSSNSYKYSLHISGPWKTVKAKDSQFSDFMDDDNNNDREIRIGAHNSKYNIYYLGKEFNVHQNSVKECWPGRTSLYLNSKERANEIKKLLEKDGYDVGLEK